MKICGIVCEYNPFHNGHRYQIDTLKSDYGFDAIVGVMSGNFMQRGDVAVYDKKVRAKAAIQNGMDLVIELPAMHSMQSAEIFAKNAVYLLNSLGTVQSIAFGTENDDISALKKIAHLITDEPPMFKNIIKQELSRGIPYFAARSYAIEKILGSRYKNIAMTPNNILAIEYIKALIRLDSHITPICIKRCGVMHDSLDTYKTSASASEIRNRINSGDFIDSFIPKNCIELYNTAKKHDISRLDTAIISHFLKSSPEQIKNTPDVNEGLENKIKKSAQICKTTNELCDAVKSKRYAHSRIRRILLNSFLEISKNDANTLPQYVKVLNFTSTGQKILHTAKKHCILPLGSSMNIVKQNHFAREIWERELIFDRIYNLTAKD